MDERDRATSFRPGCLYERRVREALANGEPAPERLPSSANIGRLPEDESAFINITRNEHAN